MEWCRQKVICLIHLFQERPCLWDKAHKQYRDRDAKNAAMLEISEKLGLSCIEVERKLNTLLTQYRREKHVQRKMESAGCLVKKPWFGYDLLKFLETTDTKYFNSWTYNRPYTPPNSDNDVLHRVLFNPKSLPSSVQPQQSQQQQPPQDDEMLFQNAEPEIVVDQILVEEPINRSTKLLDRKSSRRNRPPADNRKQISNAYRILKSAFKQSQQRDDLKIFAEGVESRLRKIKDKRKICILKHQIETLIFTVEMEELAQASIPMVQFPAESKIVSSKVRVATETDEHTKPS